MALLQVNFASKSLQRRVQMQVILPMDSFTAFDPDPDRRYPTLYLLHGIYGNDASWVGYSRIQRWAEQMGLAVVMPAGENHFYLDHTATHDCYAAYIGEELVELTRRMFPLSRRRADTFLGGFSMGGYGALRNGLAHPETFGRLIGLSVANVVEQPDRFTDDAPVFLAQRAYGEAIFGDLGALHGTDKDLLHLIDRTAQTGPRPAVYLACGLQDDLLPLNRQLRDAFTAQGYDLCYAEAAGGHDWDFWDDQIRRVLDWLPLQG